MEKELEEMMDQISDYIDAIKINIAKSKAKTLKGTTLNCAALQRLRKQLLNLQKIGLLFRKTSVKYTRREK